jgi:hypothetical protein
MQPNATPTTSTGDAVRQSQLEAARRVTEWHAQRQARQWAALSAPRPAN